MTVNFVRPKNKTPYWVYNFIEGGERRSRRAKNPDGTPAQSRRQAQAAEDSARVAARLANKQAIAQPGVYTLVMAATARAEEASHLANWRDIRHALREIVAFFGAAKPIECVAAEWQTYRNFARTQTIKTWRGGTTKASMPATAPDATDPRWHDTGRRRSAARTNRYLDQLSALLRLAHETRGPGGRPLLEFLPKIERIPEDKHDPNPVPLEILAKIETDPATPTHLRDAAALVRLFGFRLAEVFGLTADRIDFENRGYRMPAALTKAGRDEFMPANAEALTMLQRLAAGAAKREPRNPAALLIVYTPAGIDTRTGKRFAPRAVANARRAWASALKRAGVAGRYRFHDLRAAFITQIAHVASDATTQDLARHKSPSTTARYTKITDQAKRAAVEAMRSHNPESQSQRLRRA